MKTMDSSSIARPCFIEEDEDDDVESCFSQNKHNPLLFQTSSSSFLCYNKRTSTIKSTSTYGFSCPRFNKARYEKLHNHQDPHFLDSCFLCNKPLGGNKDIFMYRGDSPFCSEECRQEQIDIDEAKENKLNLSMKALRMKDQTRHSSPPRKTTHGYSFRTGTVIAT